MLVHTQGVELLRRGEVAPVIYVVVKGECVVRASHVGLDPHKTSGTAMMDLTILKVALLLCVDENSVSAVCSHPQHCMFSSALKWTPPYSR